MSKKIIKELDKLLSFLDRYVKEFINGNTTYDWILYRYLNKEENDFSKVLEEFELDKKDIYYYSYEVEIRLRALRDIMNELEYDNVLQDLINNQKPMDKDLSEIINKHFEELL